MNIYSAQHNIDAACSHVLDAISILDEIDVASSMQNITANISAIDNAILELQKSRNSFILQRMFVSSQSK